MADLGPLADSLCSARLDTAYEVVIISGGGLTKKAALAYVMLEKLGYQKVSLFIEPAEKWAELGFELEKETTSENVKSDQNKPVTTYKAPREDVIISDPAAIPGLFPTVYIASGNQVPVNAGYPNTIHMPFSDFLDPNGAPKAAKDIWDKLAKAGVTRYGEFVCVADDPGEAAINYVIFKLMGYPDIKLLLQKKN
jgi:3-mercaptopyruvate sulfurtransferase SseA